MEENYNISKVCEQLSQHLEINLSIENINDSYVLNIPKNPLKLELISTLKKKEIFNNCRKLKGTNIGISNDLTFQQRQEQKELRQYLTEARRNKNQKSFIKGNKLYIGEEEYTLDTLQNLKRNIPAASSEPSTPTITNRTEEHKPTRDIDQSANQLAANSQQHQNDKGTPKGRNKNFNKTVKTTQAASNGTTSRGRLRSQK